MVDILDTWHGLKNIHWWWRALWRWSSLCHCTGVAHACLYPSLVCLCPAYNYWAFLYRPKREFLKLAANTSSKFSKFASGHADTKWSITDNTCRKSPNTANSFFLIYFILNCKLSIILLSSVQNPLSSDQKMLYICRLVSSEFMTVLGQLLLATLKFELKSFAVTASMHYTWATTCCT